MFEINQLNEYGYAGICFDDDFEVSGSSYEEVADILEAHEKELAELKAKEQKWLLEGDIRNKLVQLNNNIESLIDVSHETYMTTPEIDTENRARLDAQIKAYWNVKSMVEDILSLDD